MKYAYILQQKSFLIPLFSGLFAVTIGLIVGLNSLNAAAVSSAGFSAGDIMSDAVMSNKNTLTESQITAFLKSKNPCNKSVSSEGSYVIDDSSTQAHWRANSSIKYQISGGKKGTTNGTFSCLANSKFGTETSSHIIYQASQDFNVNPQVLIVLLQKEQGLITDTWPNSVQIAAATGYNCPDDDAGCRATDAAFKKQVRGAAHMFDSILTKNPYWTNYYPVGTNYIQYNPSASCGGSNVYIKNLATSALYNYTPYQPNSAALAAGYGTAPCGAYGNRNFYLYFTDWFGSTHYTLRGSIDEYYQNNNGASQLGKPTQNEATYLDGYMQCFEKGCIAGKDGNYYQITGSIGKYYLDNPQDAASVGLPLANEQVFGDGTEHYQKFQHGYVTGKWASGYFAVRGSIADAYTPDDLGVPLEKESATVNSGRKQCFSKGCIAGKNGQYYPITGSIGQEFKSLKRSELDNLGLPRDIEFFDSRDKLAKQYFDDGVISGRNGVYSVHLY